MFEGKEYIYAVYTEGSFVKAAQKLFVTQPALSTAVKKLEKKIGSPLFDRSSSPVRLTPVGEIYMDAVEKLMILEQNTLNQINSVNGLKAGKLTLGGSNFYASYVVPDMIAKFSETYPQIRIELVEGTSRDLEEKLSSDEIDILIDNCCLDESIYDKIIISGERLVLAVPKAYEVNGSLVEYRLGMEEIRDGKLDKRKALPLQELGPVPFIMLKEGNDLYRRAEKIFISQDYRPKVVLQPDQLMTAFHIACKGVGVTFVSDSLIKNIAYEAPLYYYRIDDAQAFRSMYKYWKRSKYLTRAMEEFLKC